MAKKMFYSLEEAAEKLSMSEQEIKDLASRGELQQFRDRDKLMFKRDQIDRLAEGQSEQNTEDTANFITIDEGVDDEQLLEVNEPAPRTPEDSGDTDAITLSDDDLDEDSDPSEIGLGEDDEVGSGLDEQSQIGDLEEMGDMSEMQEMDEQPAHSGGGATSGQRTGVSIFDSNELEDPADEGAQTMITGGVVDEEELALESVGSGSGLLDLTRESDDTSLGAELLDEIYPSGNDASDGGGFGSEGSAAGQSFGSETVDPQTLDFNDASNTSGHSAGAMDGPSDVHSGLGPVSQGSGLDASTDFSQSGGFGQSATSGLGPPSGSGSGSGSSPFDMGQFSETGAGVPAGGSPVVYQAPVSEASTVALMLVTTLATTVGLSVGLSVIIAAMMGVPNPVTVYFEQNPSMIGLLAAGGLIASVLGGVLYGVLGGFSKR